MIVRLTSAARADLGTIGDYIAEDNPRRARSFTRELRQRCAGLSDFPRRFPLLPDHEESGIHHFGHGNYLIFYRVADRRVEILRILHGAQDYVAVLFPN